MRSKVSPAGGCDPSVSLIVGCDVRPAIELCTAMWLYACVAVRVGVYS
jgi:hypothetical protein